MEWLTFICLPPPPLSFSSSASLNLNVSASHYPVAMKTHLTAHLSTSDRCLWIWVCESVCKCVAISPNVCICFHTVRMNHHVDRVESPSLCYKLDSARYLVIMYCMCVSCLRALHELYERIQRDICVTERGLSLLWDCLVFSLSLSRVKKTALSHVTSHSPKWAGKQGRWGAPGPMGNKARIQPLRSLALGTPSRKEPECQDVCARLWLHMMGGRRFI